MFPCRGGAIAAIKSLRGYEKGVPEAGTAEKNSESASRGQRMRVDSQCHEADHDHRFTTLPGCG
jgi:hypothetical protein